MAIPLGDQPSNLPLRINDVAHMYGQNAGSTAFPSSGNSLSDGAGNLMGLYAAPRPYRRWWRVHCHTIVERTAVAGWSALDVRLQLHDYGVTGYATDVNGRQETRFRRPVVIDFVNFHSIGGTVFYYLEANIGYSIFFQSATTLANVIYWQGQQYHRITGITFAEGAI